MESDKQKVLKGVFWTAVGKYSSLVVTTVVSMILARLLTPSEFGTVAIASVLIAFFSMVSSMGVAPAIIQRNDLTDDDLSSIFTFSILIGAILGGLFALLSWPIGSFYKNPDVIPVCQILAFNLFFSTINMVPGALMSKYLRFKENAIRNLALQLIIGPIAVVCALCGAGVYSLLISPVVGALGIFLFNYYFYPVKFSLKINRASIKKILSFSTYQFAFQFINYFTVNYDKLIIGRVMGSSNLGYYQKSYQLIQLPASNISGVVYPVLQPIFAKYQDEKELLLLKYSKMIKLIASICIPLGVFLFFSGEEVIRLFYGPKWDLAVPAFKIMSAALPILVILPVTGTFFQASNEIKYLFHVGAINAIVTILSFTLVSISFNTVESVAYAALISNISCLIVTYYYMYVKVLKKTISLAIKTYYGPFIVGAIMAGIVYLVNLILCDYTYTCLIVKVVVLVVTVPYYLHISKQVDVFSWLRIQKNKIIKR